MIKKLFTWTHLEVWDNDVIYDNCVLTCPLEFDKITSGPGSFTKVVVPTVIPAGTKIDKIIYHSEGCTFSIYQAGNLVGTFNVIVSFGSQATA